MGDDRSVSVIVSMVLTVVNTGVVLPSVHGRGLTSITGTGLAPPSRFMLYPFVTTRQLAVF